MIKHVLEVTKLYFIEADTEEELQRLTEKVKDSEKCLENRDGIFSTKFDIKKVNFEDEKDEIKTLCQKLIRYSEFMKDTGVFAQSQYSTHDHVRKTLAELNDHFERLMSGGKSVIEWNGFMVTKSQMELLNKPFSVLQKHRIPPIKDNRAHNYYSYNKTLDNLKSSNNIVTIGDFLKYIQTEIDNNGKAVIKGLTSVLAWQTLISFFTPHKIYFKFYNNRFRWGDQYQTPSGSFRPIAIQFGGSCEY